VTDVVTRQNEEFEETFLQVLDEKKRRAISPPCVMFSPSLEQAHVGNVLIA
jgi:hypothetical protein